MTSLNITSTPYTPGPWTTGPHPHGHCRIYSAAETHAIARTYGPELNGIGICSLTGPQNAADAALIALSPEMMEVLRTLNDAASLSEKPEDRERAMNLLSHAMADAIKLIDRFTTATAHLKKPTD